MQIHPSPTPSQIQMEQKPTDSSLPIIDHFQKSVWLVWKLHQKQNLSHNLNNKKDNVAFLYQRCFFIRFIPSLTCVKYETS